MLIVTPGWAWPVKLGSRTSVIRSSLIPESDDGARASPVGTVGSTGAAVFTVIDTAVLAGLLLPATSGWIAFTAVSVSPVKGQSTVL